MTTVASVTVSNNRADTIADAIASVIGHVDLAILVDTGITDDTIERARNVAGKKLRVAKRAWRDFSDARNAGLDYARECGADWALMVDTDERIRWSDKGLLGLHDILDAERFDVFCMQSADNGYNKEKIIRLSSGVRYVGPTHEVPLGGARAMFPTAVFDELPKTHEQLYAKRVRDVAMLNDWIAKPENAEDGRWWYYLGDSHFGLGDLDKAIAAFARCVELRHGPSEEGAWAAYRQADCLVRQKKYPEAVEVCARGLARHSGVAELAWLAAVASGWAGWTEQAVCWARMSAALGRFVGASPTRHLFVEEPALYELPYDVLRFIAPTEQERVRADRAFHLAKRARLGVTDDRGLDVLSLNRGSPKRHEARTMLRPPSIRSLCSGTHVTTLEPKVDVRGYHTMNPSVCVHKGQLWIVVRFVNYTIENGQYVPADPDGNVRTVNALGKFTLHDSGAMLHDLSLMQDLDKSPRVESARVLGYEDVRIFSVKDKLWASATVVDRVPNCAKIALLELDDDGDVTKATVQETGRAIEKNWMPITSCDDIAWLYSLDPATVRYGHGGQAIDADRRFALDHLRGSSQVIAIDDGFLCVTHEVIPQDGWGCRRIYLHRFVRLDSQMRVVAVSPAWTFEDGHYGIEFCNGLCRDPANAARLVLAYGVEDREAKLLVVDEASVLGLDWIGTTATS